MSGNRYLLDTNAVIFLLNGTSDIGERLSEAEWIGISVITKLEFLCFEGLTEADKTGFLRFCDRIDVVNLSDQDEKLTSSVIALRSRYKLKLPDAVIAATTIVSDAALITGDAHFSKVSELTCLDPNADK
jgi:tRNA(fMet)-specific endonuclease VapC